MARKSIFELLECNLDLNAEARVIESMFAIDTVDFINSTIEKHIDKYYFLNWKYRGTTRSTEHLREICNISHYDLIHSKSINTELAYFEYVYNMIHLLKNNCDNFIESSLTIYDAILDNLCKVSDRINFEFNEIDITKHILVEKCSSATAVSEIIENSKVIEYNHYLLKGNTEGKRDILKLLANQFETVKPNLKQNGYKDLADDMGYLLNNLNIRHSSDELVKNMSQVELEEWYDTTYDMFLLCILADNHVNVKSDIKALKQSG